MPNSKHSDTFAEQSRLPEPGIVGEFWDFLRFNKKWWLTPIVLVLLMVSALIFLGGTGAAPLVYTLW